MISVDELELQIKNYQNLYADVIDHMSEFVRISDLFDQHEEYPLAPHSGIYCVFNKQQSLIYIGKASANSTLGNRLCYWFGGRTYRLSGTWNEDPVYLKCYSTKEPYQAPSLEEFLIRELKPPENLVGQTSK